MRRRLDDSNGSVMMRLSKLSSSLTISFSSVLPASSSVFCFRFRPGFLYRTACVPTLTLLLLELAKATSTYPGCDGDSVVMSFNGILWSRTMCCLHSSMLLYPRLHCPHKNSSFVPMSPTSDSIGMSIPNPQVSSHLSAGQTIDSLFATNCACDPDDTDCVTSTALLSSLSASSVTKLLADSSCTASPLSLDTSACSASPLSLDPSAS